MDEALKTRARLHAHAALDLLPADRLAPPGPVTRAAPGQSRKTGRRVRAEERQVMATV